MARHLLLFILCITCLHTAAQDRQDSVVLRQIYDHVLTNGYAYTWLDHLANNIGGRLSGSPEADEAVAWAKTVMDTLGLDSIWLQPVMVPHWVRGEAEQAKILSGRAEIPVNITALGGSVATPETGVTAEVVEVHSYEELEELGKEAIEGKIVFYNTPMDPKHIHTFHAYGNCSQYRFSGAGKAAEFGAVGMILRSLSHKIDEFPHTGVMRYPEDGEKIPAAAISTLHAEQLSGLLKQNKTVKFFMKMNCETLPDKLSYNVIGEIRGTEKPDEIMLVGGHLDSWDNGDGAHDDGAGCVQSMQVLATFKALGIKPRHTVRAVLFMNEENGVAGGRKYYEEVVDKQEKHLIAIESDAGGFTPRGFSVDDTITSVEHLRNFSKLFEPYLIHYFEPGFSGVDIYRLKESGTTTIGLVPDSQRYFDYHHAASDTFEAVNKRELELGAATMASLIYLLDKYPVPKPWLN